MTNNMQRDPFLNRPQPPQPPQEDHDRLPIPVMIALSIVALIALVAVGLMIFG